MWKVVIQSDRVRWWMMSRWDGLEDRRLLNATCSIWSLFEITWPQRLSQYWNVSCKRWNMLTELLWQRSDSSRWLHRNRAATNAYPWQMVPYSAQCQHFPPRSRPIIMWNYAFVPNYAKVQPRVFPSTHLIIGTSRRTRDPPIEPMTNGTATRSIAHRYANSVVVVWTNQGNPSDFSQSNRRNQTEAVQCATTCRFQRSSMLLLVTVCTMLFARTDKLVISAPKSRETTGATNTAYTGYSILHSVFNSSHPCSQEQDNGIFLWVALPKRFIRIVLARLGYKYHTLSWSPPCTQV